MCTVQDLVSAFSAINTDEALVRFVQTFGLVKAPEAEHSHAQVLGIYRGTVEGREVSLTHRWYDPSQAFSIRPDINKLALAVAGMEPCHHEYEDSPG